MWILSDGRVHRQHSSSIFNPALTYFMTGYNIDLTQTSIVLCKLRPFVATTSPLLAQTCLCLATIDQCLSLTNRWPRATRHSVAWRAVLFALVFWSLHGLCVAIFFKHRLVPSTGQRICIITNETFADYYSRFYMSLLLGFIPLLIRTGFGLRAFSLARNLANRQVPIVRLARDKQLTSMVSVARHRSEYHVILSRF